MAIREVKLAGNSIYDEPNEVTICEIATDIYKQEVNTSRVNPKFLHAVFALEELYKGVQQQSLMKIITHLAANCNAIKSKEKPGKLNNYLENFLVNEQMFVSQAPCLFSSIVKSLEYSLVKFPKAVGIGIFGSWLGLPSTMSDLDCVLFSYRNALSSAENRDIQYEISSIYRDHMSPYRSSRFEYAGASFPYPNFDLSKNRDFFSDRASSILVITRDLEEQYIIHHQLHNNHK